MQLSSRPLLLLFLGLLALPAGASAPCDRLEFQLRPESARKELGRTCTELGRASSLMGQHCVILNASEFSAPTVQSVCRCVAEDRGTSPRPFLRAGRGVIEKACGAPAPLTDEQKRNVIIVGGARKPAEKPRSRP